MPYITIEDPCLDGHHKHCPLNGGEGDGYHFCCCECHWEPEELAARPYMQARIQLAREVAIQRRLESKS
jgi:hypothetical protein